MEGGVGGGETNRGGLAGEGWLKQIPSPYQATLSSEARTSSGALTGLRN